jgi:glycosyltransferase involved in cell wall biosynthesis
MQAAAPKVSVVLVTYNRAAQLPTTLDSLLAQTHTDFELIVSDDCSTDGTPAVCERYAQQDPRIRYRRNPRNLRMPGNLNAAIGEARGAYLAITHDGDLYRADLLEKWAGALDRHPSAGFVFNGYREGARPGHTARSWLIDMPECMNGREFLERIYVPNPGGCPIYGTTMVRKACLDAVGLFDPRYSMHSDIEMWVRLASRYDVAYVPELLITMMPREANHVLVGHRWWELTVDVRAKRMAHAVVHGRALLPRLRFEARVRRSYAFQTLVMLKHRRWKDAWLGLKLVLTGREDVAPPY